jgi:hypothetical protein
MHDATKPEAFPHVRREAEARAAGAVAPGEGSGRPAVPRGASPRVGPRSEEGIHFVPNDGRRFPFCGSWRSNWNHTDVPERATCPQCRARLAAPPAP